MAENKRTALEQAYMEREQLKHETEGASESTRVALSAISGRELLKTKTETARIKRDREIAEQQNQALINQGAASAAITMEKTKASQALSLERRRQNEVLTMLGRGVFDPSFAGILGMQEGVVKEMADKKAAEIAAQKAAARAQAEYEAYLNTKKQGSQPEKYSNLTTDNKGAIEAAYANYGNENPDTTDTATYKNGVLTNAGVYDEDTMGMVRDLNAIVGLGGESKEEQDAARINQENRIKKNNQASAYFDEMVTKKIVEKEAAGEELSAYEFAYKATPDGAALVAKYIYENAPLEERESAYKNFVNTIQNSVTSIFGQYSEDGSYIDGTSSVQEIIDNYTEKRKAGENLDEEEQSAVQQQINDLEGMIETIQTLVDEEYLDGDAAEINITYMGDMIYTLEDILLWSENYSEEDAKYAAMDLEYGDKTIEELEELRPEKENDILGWLNWIGHLVGGAAVGVDDMSIETAAAWQSTVNGSRPYNQTPQVGSMEWYIEERKERGNQLDEDMEAQQLAMPFAGENSVEQAQNAIEYYGGEIDEYNHYHDLFHGGDAASLPAILYTVYTTSKPEWLGAVEEEDGNSSFYYKAKNGEKWAWYAGQFLDEEGFISPKELEERHTENLKSQEVLTNYYRRNINEISLDPEEAEKEAGEFIENYDAEEFKMYGGEKHKYRGGSGYAYTGWNHFYKDVDRFVNGDYGHFTKNEAQNILALLNGDDPDMAFDYYMKLRENAVHRKAESLGGWSYVVGMNAGPIDMLIRGGYMLENASRQSYAWVGSNIMSAAHQVSLEKMSQNTGAWGYTLEFLYQGGYTVIDMMPVVGLSMIPYVGQAASSAYLYAKSFATTYDSKIREGRRADEALTGAVLTATSEVVMEKLLSGIGKVGGAHSLSNTLSAAIDNLAATHGVKMALKLAGKMGSEGFEEFLQEVLSPFISKIAAEVNGITDAELEEIDWEEAGKSFLLGAFTGLGFGSVEVASEYRMRKQEDVRSERALRLESAGKNKDATKVIGMAAELGNKRANVIMTAIKNKSPLYEGKEGLFAYASPADITNMRISIRRNAKRLAMDRVRNALENSQGRDHSNDEQILGIFEALLGNQKIDVKQMAVLLNDEVAVKLLNRMTGENIAALMPNEALALARLTAFVGADFKIDKARLDAFRDAFDDLDYKAIENILKYEDLVRAEVSEGNFGGVIYEDPAIEQVLTAEEKEAVEEMKELSKLTHIFYLVTDAFNSGTYLANGIMTIKREDLSKGAYYMLGREAYYMTQQLDPEKGEVIKGFLMKEIEQMIGADGIEAKKKNLRQQGVGEDLLVDEICAEMMPAVFLQGNYKAAEELATLDPEAAEKLRDVIGSIREHLAEEYVEKVSEPEAVEGTGIVRFDEGVKATSRRQRLAVAYAKHIASAIGIDIVFYDSTISGTFGAKANGYFFGKDNSIHLDLQKAEAGKGTVLFTLSHELVHFAQKFSAEKYNALADFLVENYGTDTMERLIQNKMEQLETDDRKLAKSEVIADACERMLIDSDAIIKLQALKERDAGLWEIIKEHIRNLMEKVRAMFRGVSPTTPEGIALQEMTDVLEQATAMFEDMVVDAAVTYQQTGGETLVDGQIIYDIKDAVDPASYKKFQDDFERNVDKILASKNHGIRGSVVIGRTPPSLTQIGINQLPLTITPAHIYSIAKTKAEAIAEGRYNKKFNYHGLGAKAVKQISEKLSDPIMVLQHHEFTNEQQKKSASTHKVIAVVELVVNGKRVIAPIEIDAEAKLGSKIYDSNHVATYFDKNSVKELIQEAVAKENIGDVGFFYLDKKRAMQIFKTAGTNYPKTLNTHDSNVIIRNIALKVNRKISDFKQSQQFKRWFGDWQNDSENASKVVNADGTPKIMYLFDRRKAKAGSYGRGFYFTDSASHGGQYGNVRAFYLDIKNPLDASLNSHRITKKQLRAFLNEVAQNEDYGIENYGEYATVDSLMESFKGKSDFDVLQDINATCIGDFVAAVELFNQINGTKYDGIITPTETVAFRATQIKSATDNVGTFDGNNPDFLYSLSYPKTFSEAMADTVSQETTELYDRLTEAIKQHYAEENAAYDDFDLETEIDFETLPAKAQKYIRDSKNELLTSLGFRTRGKHDEWVISIADKMADEYLLRGEISEQAAQMLHDAADSYLTKETVDAAVEAFRKRMHVASRYVAERMAKNAEKENGIHTNEELLEAYASLKEARKKYEAVMSKNLLTEEDQQIIGRLLRGDLTVDEISSNYVNGDGIRSVYEAKLEYERLSKRIRAYNAARKEKLRSEANELLANISSWKDKKVGFWYMRETMERNVYDIASSPEEAEALIAWVFKPIHDATAAMTRMKEDYRARVKALGLKTRRMIGDEVSESYAVQLLGEAQDNIRVIDESDGRLIEKDGKTKEEWQALINELWINSPKLDKAKIENAVKEFRAIYDELFEMMNEVRLRNGYEPVDYRSGYFPHFQPGDTEGVMALFSKVLGINPNVDILPTTINGLTHTFRPGIQWFGNAKRRTGFETGYDAVRGFDKYIEGIASVIHQTDNIQKLRALSSQIRYLSSDEGVQQQVDDINGDPLLDEEDKLNRLEKLYKDGKFALSSFVVNLDEYTNSLANKKSSLDRGVENILGRRFYEVAKWAENRIAANMISGNLGSAITNFIPIQMGKAEVGNINLAKAHLQMINSWVNDDGFVARSTFLTSRRGSDPLVRSWYEGAADFVGKPMEWIDRYASEILTRARYIQNIQKGLSEKAAIDEADSWAAGLMADRSKGGLPTFFESRNPLVKIFTMFQLEVNNQFSYLFKDIPRRYGKEAAGRIALVLLRICLGALMFNDLYEKAFGRRPAFDPLSILNDAVGDLSGYKLPNIYDIFYGAVSGDMPSFESEKKELSDATMGLATNVAKEVPFIGGWLEGGRFPVSSALPDLENVWKGLVSQDWDQKKKEDALLKEGGKLLYYYLLPTLGGQLKKGVEGGMALARGGSYAVNTDGKKVLQYPVDADNWWDYVRTVLLGKSTTEEAVNWVDSDFDSYSVEETDVYKQLLEQGVDAKQAAQAIKAIDEIKNDSGKADKDAQRTYILDLDLTDEQKYTLYQMTLSESAAEKVEALILSGVDRGALMKAYAEYRNIDEDPRYEGDEKGKATEFAYYLDKEVDHINAKKIKDTMTYGVLGAVKATEYEEMVSGGASFDEAYEIYFNVSALNPENGEKSVKNSAKYEEVINTPLSEEGAKAALLAYATDADKRRMIIAFEENITAESFANIKTNIDRLNDLDGKSSASNARIEAAIRHEDGLTDRQRAILWQLFSSSDSAKNNPFSASVGWEIVAKVKAYKDAEE